MTVGLLPVQGHTSRDDTPLNKRIFFFDIDNTLYDPSAGIDRLMQERILDYMVNIGVSQDSALAYDLCFDYYRTYGLTVRGLILHHQIDPVDYNEKVDGSLPIEEILKPDPELRSMLEQLKTRKWAFTNAGLDHATRVLNALGVADQFEGITYCDYSVPDFPCKPEAEAYRKAMFEAGVDNPYACYFVDDSAANVDAAVTLGWTGVHLTPEARRSTVGHAQIDKITDLPKVFPELWS